MSLTYILAADNMGLCLLFLAQLLLKAESPESKSTGMKTMFDTAILGQNASNNRKFLLIYMKD